MLELLHDGTDPKMVVILVIILLFSLTLSFSFHEYMHAACAVWLGDPTPDNMGRLTLNPLAHMDPFGTILLLIAGFGWGKPVVYNPSRLHRFKNRRLMNIMVALAGVTGNFIIALVCSILWGIISVFIANADETIIQITYTFFEFTRSFSLMLLGFNLIPVPPLDGFRVLEELLPLKVKYSDGYNKFQKYMSYGIFILFILGYVTKISVLGWLVNIISFPFGLACSAVQGFFTMLVQMIVG
ncbi:MAG: site-2 protease family protein [Clostridiales bacterium]|nr:site-2 protease family protein [Clostridiales bacterium]